MFRLNHKNTLQTVSSPVIVKSPFLAHTVGVAHSCPGTHFLMSHKLEEITSEIIASKRKF